MKLLLNSNLDSIYPWWTVQFRIHDVQWKSISDENLLFAPVPRSTLDT